VFRALRTTLTIFLILLCLELPAALRFVHWGVVFGRLTGESNYLDTAYVADPERGFRRRANDHWKGRPPTGREEWDLAPALVQPIDFTTDGRGYRNPADLEKADVALIGDSFVEGYRVSDEQTAARVLQARLGRPVANLGVAGYGPMQELVVLKQDAARLKPAVVVWFFFEGNDLYDDANFEALLLDQAPGGRGPAGPKEQSAQQSWPRRSFTLNALGLLRPWAGSLVPSRARWPYYGYLPRPDGAEEKVYFLDSAAMIPWGSYEATCWERSRKALHEAADLCRERGVHLLFCYVPMEFRVYQPLVTLPPESPCQSWELWPLPQLFADFCRSADVPCLDLTEPLREEIRRGGSPFAVGDVHWGPHGHALVADRLAQELRRRGWLTDERAAR
jgi:hypothetical protein